MTRLSDLFDEYIADRLRAGGEPEYMVQLSKVYSRDDSSVRDYAFQQWLSEEDIPCSKCGKAFSPKDLSYSDDALCPRCRKREC